jgi:tRNA nucleotidyltransferase (CCA-adding enzyme)
VFQFLRKKNQKDAPDDQNEPSIRDALLADRPSDIFWRWSQTGKLPEIMPDLALLRSVSQLPAHRDNALIHTLKVVDAIEPTPVRRWAALLHDIGKGPAYIETPEGRSRFFEHDHIGAAMVPEIMHATHEDADLIDTVRRLVSLHMRPISYDPAWTDAAVRRLREEAEEGRGEQGWRDMLALARADLRGYLPEPIDRGLWVLDQLETRAQRLLDQERQAALEQAASPRSPLDGHRLLELAHRAPGPWIADLKDHLLTEVLAGRLDVDDEPSAETVALDWLAQHTD